MATTSSPNRGGHQTVAPRGASETIEVKLELDRGADPISGRIMLGEAAVPFQGWLGLAGALQRGLEAEDAGRKGS